MRYVRLSPLVLVGLTMGAAPGTASAQVHWDVNVHGGLGKRFRYVASHASGKIEIVGQVGDDLILRYHEARRPEDEGRLLAWPAARPLLWPDEAVATLCEGS